MPNKLICAIFFFFALAGCTIMPTDARDTELAKNYYRKHVSLDEIARNFGEYSLEEQYDIYIFGNQVVHPPATFLAHEFAKQGTAIIPFLSKKLKIAKEEATIRDIVLVFKEMAILKLYNFSKDQELMDLVSRRVHGMKGIWKEITLEFVSRIRSEATTK